VIDATQILMLLVKEADRNVLHSPIKYL